MPAVTTQFIYHTATFSEFSRGKKGERPFLPRRRNSIEQGTPHQSFPRANSI